MPIAHRLVGDDDAWPKVVPGSARPAIPAAVHVVLDVLPALADLEVLTDAHDRDQPVPERRGGLGRRRCVVLVDGRSGARVADHDEGAAQLGRERPLISPV